MYRLHGDDGSTPEGLDRWLRGADPEAPGSIPSTDTTAYVLLAYKPVVPFVCIACGGQRKALDLTQLELAEPELDVFIFILHHLYLV